MSRPKRDFAQPVYLENIASMDKYSKPFIMSPDFWEAKKHQTIDMNKLNWEEEKMFIDGVLNPRLKTIDPRRRRGDPIKNKSGGIYIFIIKSPVLIDIANYVMYIGKVEGNEKYGLSQRFQGYYSGSYKGSKRSNIKDFFYKWSDHIYVKYTKIRKNEAIKSMEDSLIDTIVPPVNHAMGSTEMQGARDAYGR